VFIVSTYYIYQRTALSWPGLWLNTKTARRREVTHPSTNQARRKYSYFVDVRDDVITISQTVKLLLVVVDDLKSTYSFIHIRLIEKVVRTQLYNRTNRDKNRQMNEQRCEH